MSKRRLDRGDIVSRVRLAHMRSKWATLLALGLIEGEIVDSIVIVCNRGVVIVRRQLDGCA